MIAWALRFSYFMAIGRNRHVRPVDRLMSGRLFMLIIGALLLSECQSLNGLDASTVVRPEQFGAVGNGLQDDTDSVIQAIGAGRGGALELSAGAIYLISRTLEIAEKIHIRGGGILQAVPDIEARIGTRGNDSLIRFSESAAGSTINGLIVDLGGSGRNAVDVAASDMRIENLLVRNYHKKFKADGNNHRQSESGLRIRGTGNVVNGLHCEDMTTGVHDAVPRCVTVQGGARDILLRNISGKNITGGIVVGSAMNLRIDGYDFRKFSDNGIYLLPGAVGTIATNGYLENGREPVVFKQDQGSRVSGLKIHNMGMSFGLENTSDAILEDVEISHDNELMSRPAFIRSRPKNKLSRDVLIRRIAASMPLGDSLFSMGYGALENVEINNSSFFLDVGADAGDGIRLVRQRRGQPLRLVDTHIQMEGPGASAVQRAVIFVPRESRGELRNICERCQVAVKNRKIALQLQRRKP